MKKRVITILMIVMAGAAMIVTYGIYLNHRDDPQNVARQLVPLGPQHKYVISKNQQGANFVDKNGQEHLLSSGSYYTIRNYDEYTETPHLEKHFSIIGRVVGSSDTDLASYLDKPVWIQGEINWGIPLLIGEATRFQDTLDRQVVLHIKELYLVDSQE